MAKLNYTEEANRLVKAIDIAIDAFSKFPPKNWDEKIVKHTIAVYTGWKEDTLNALPEFNNLRSLKYRTEDVFTFFQEGSGGTVDYFWQQINKEQLGYKRENKLAKILKRGKIKNDIEHNFIIDVLVPYQQEGIINQEDLKVINQMLLAFENKSSAKG